MPDINKQPWAEWLEDGLKQLLEKKCDKVCLIAKAADGEIITGYFHCGVMDKAEFALNIQYDAMLAVTLANADLIKKKAEEMEAEQEE